MSPHTTTPPALARPRGGQRDMAAPAPPHDHAPPAWSQRPPIVLLALVGPLHLLALVALTSGQAGQRAGAAARADAEHAAMSAPAEVP